jgi:hypothetical protein
LLVGGHCDEATHSCVWLSVGRAVYGCSDKDPYVSVCSKMRVCKMME